MDVYGRINCLFTIRSGHLKKSYFTFERWLAFAAHQR